VSTAAAQPALRRQPSAQALERLRAARARGRQPAGWLTYFSWALGLALLAWAWRGAEIRPLDLCATAATLAPTASEFFPPDFRDWRIYAREMVVTVHIAIWGTVLAVVAAVPMGLLCSVNIAPRWVHQPVRRLMDACRAINEMVFAMLFIVAVGLGPFAGVLALAVHTTGTLAKLFSEAVEAIDPRPVEGIRATGAHTLVEVVSWRHPAGVAAVAELHALPLREQCAQRQCGGHGGRGRHRRGAVRGDSRLSVRADLRGADHSGGQRHADRPALGHLAQAVHLMEPFAWHQPVDLRFGDGCSNELSATLGHQPVVVLAFEPAGALGLRQRWQYALGARLQAWVPVADRLSSIAYARELVPLVWPHLKPDTVLVAVGGGTTLDLAKVLRCKPLDSDFEALAKALRGQAPWPAMQQAPLWLLPTTAGTGSELTRWATVWDTEAQPPASAAWTSPGATRSAPLWTRRSP
jgi:ABC-type nitrate/sulfonate/bicarbonate transport system permease component